MAVSPNTPTLSSHLPAVNKSTIFDCEHLSSLIKINLVSNITTVYPLRCKRWSCTYCCMMNEILLREKVLAGLPTKMLTLTFRPDRKLTPRETVHLVRPAVNRLYQRLRYHAGEWEAATFLELHRSGYPHWHALVRGGYVPQSLISDLWRSLTQSTIVDIRKIHDVETAMRYVSKYVTKSICYLQRAQLGRTVSFTRHYLPPRQPHDRDPDETWCRDHRQPWEVIRCHSGWSAIETSDRVVELHPPDNRPPLCPPSIRAFSSSMPSGEEGAAP